jgi:hypothetical protein
MHLIITVVAQEHRDHNEARQARAYSGDDRDPHVTLSALCVNDSVRLESDEEIKLPDGHREKYCYSNHGCVNAGSVSLNITHL